MLTMVLATVIAVGAGENLVAVRDRVRELKKPVTVELAGGDYRLEDTLEFDQRDSGVVWTSKAGGEARLTFARPVEDGCFAMKSAGGLERSRSPFELRASAPMFFYDGKWAVEARWPNEGFTNIVSVVDSGIIGTYNEGVAPALPTQPGSFVFPGDRPLNWDFSDPIEICGYLAHDWAYERLRVRDFNPSNRVMRLAERATYGIGARTWGENWGRRFFVSGVRAELDAPGEYFYDRKTGKVEFIPPAGGVKELVGVDTDAPLITVKDAQRIEFRGLICEYVVGDALVFSNCASCVVSGCTLRNIGGNAVRAIAVSDFQLTGSRMEQLGAGGALVSGGKRATLTESGNLIADNEIRDYGRYRRTYSAAVGVNGCGTRVLRNRIHESPHFAITYGGNEHLIAENEIYDIIYETGDAGAIYSGRDPASRGNRIERNYLHDIGRREATVKNVMALYLDDMDCGDSFISNRIERVPTGILLGGGQDNAVIGNTFRECFNAMQLDARGLDWAEKNFDDPLNPSWQLTRKAREFKPDREPWKSRYPEFADYPVRENRREPFRNVIKGNVFERSRDLDILFHHGAAEYYDVTDNRSTDGELKIHAMAKRTSAPKAVFTPEEWVDTRLGCMPGRGSCVMGPCVPHGSVLPGPDGVKVAPNGYYPGDTVIGFSQLHCQGTGGVPTYGLFRLVITHDGISTSRLETVETRPYYFKAKLPDLKTTLEMSATDNGVIYRLDLPEGATIAVDENCKIGKANARNEKGEFIGNWNPAPYNCYCHWTREGEYVRIAVSFNSQEEARRFHDEELQGKTLEEISAAAKQLWHTKLMRLEYKAPDDAERTRFYTHLYHAFVQPRRRGGLWDDHYTIWDTWKTLFPLMCWLEPEVAAECINSFADRLERNGACEVAFIQGKEYRTGQGGNDVDNVIAHAIVNNLPGIDRPRLWKVLERHARDRTPEYLTNGWTAADLKHDYCRRLGSGSATLAFAYNDACAARVARILGKLEEAERLEARSHGWTNLWNTACREGEFTGFVVGRRSDGTFLSNDPRSGYNQSFYEGSSWEYTFNVWHDLDRLAELCGGRERLIARLEYAFEHGLIDFGNEPSFYTPLLFHLLDRPDLTKKWAAAMKAKFPPDGCPGDDDSGAMGSLYVFLSMGYVPIAGTNIIVPVK